METLRAIFDGQRASTAIVDFLPGAVSAALILLLFWIFLRVTTPALKKILAKADFDPALISFAVDDILRLGVWMVAAVMAAAQIGLDVGAALAGIGVAGIAIGFAAQDSLANTISGFLIFWDKPFRAGDFITTQSSYGRVAEITMRTTRIRTQENTYVVIPNKKIIDDPLTNHSMYGETRINIPVGIAYKEQVSEARDVLLRAVDGIEDILNDPRPDVVVTELADSSVNLLLRVWVASAAVERPVYFRALELAKGALDEAGIQIPFPHLQLFVDDVDEAVWQGATRGLARGA